MEIVYSLIAVVFVCCFILTPLVIKFAKKHNLVDIPKDKRRVHTEPMPRVGGIAIVLSMFIGFLLYYFITKDIPSIALNEKFLGYILGALIIAAMGLIDDVFNLRARYKFIFQVAAACIVYYFSIRISGIKIPFIYTDIINFGWFDFPITLLWVIGVTNAVNLIDGLDGLAAGISTISATALLVIFIATSASLEAIIITAALVGATLGFLPYNFNPAKTFMRRCRIKLFRIYIISCSYNWFCKRICFFSNNSSNSCFGSSNIRYFICYGKTFFKRTANVKTRWSTYTS